MYMRINLCLFVAVLILSAAFYYLFYRTEMSAQSIENIMCELEKNKDDDKLNKCAKYLIDTNKKVTLRSFENYNACISEIKRSRAEQELRKMIKSEH